MPPTAPAALPQVLIPARRFHDMLLAEGEDVYGEEQEAVE